MQEFVSIPSVFQSQISQFAKVVEEAKPLTQPSIIVEGGIQQIGLKKLKPEDIEKFLFMHPVIPRGIEIRANRMTARGYTITPANKSQRAKRAAAEMVTLIKNSGDIAFINSLIKNTYAFGNGYATLFPNKDESKIVRINLEHPIFFRIAKEKLADAEKKQRLASLGIESLMDAADDFYIGYGPNKINPQTRKPSAYTQVRYRDASKTHVIPSGEELTPDQVVHLVYDTWGDEVEGISVVQYIHMLINYLLNMEEAAAENIYRNGFTQKKVLTELMTENDLKALAKNIKEMNAKDAIILSKGMDVENLLPGTSQFPQFHEVFITLLALRLGVPKPLLTLDGTSTNKATIDEMVKDMMHDLQADELKTKTVIEEQIFRVVCKLLYGDNFEEIPSFDFNPYRESKDALAARNFRVAQTLDSLARSVATISQLGYTQRAEQLLKFVDQIIPEEEYSGLKEDKPNVPERRDTPIQKNPRSVASGDNPEGKPVGRPDGSDVVNVRGEKSVKGKSPPNIKE